MLSRFPDWPSRLEVFLFANRMRKFQYGSWDCSLFVADCIQAMTGIDLASDYRGYSRRSEALEQARLRAGEGSVQNVAKSVASVYGMPEVPISQARRGDMALIRRPRDYSLGLVALNGMELLIALQTGFGAVPLSRAYRVWRV